MNGGGAPVRFQTVSGDLRVRGLSTVRPPSAIPNPTAEPAETASSPPAPTNEAPTAQTQPNQTSGEDAQMQVLTALQRGEIGVDEALGRLAALKKARSEGENNGTA